MCTDVGCVHLYRDHGYEYVGLPSFFNNYLPTSVRVVESTTKTHLAERKQSLHGRPIDHLSIETMVIAS